MSEGARVDSIDALRHLRVSLIKFAEAANVALADADGEMSRTLSWLETEAGNFWSGQIRKRQENVARCIDAVRQKKIFKDATGRPQSAHDEEKALAAARKRLEEAEQKMVAVRKYAHRLQKEIEMYRGSVQRFATSVQSEIPAAASRLDNLVNSLDAYASYTAQSGEDIGADASIAAAGGGGVMARAGGAGEKISYPALRAKTPSPESRLAAPPSGELPAIRPPDSNHAPRLAAMSLPLSPVSADLTLVMATGTLLAPRIYLQRLQPASPADSGWFVGPTAYNAEPCTTLPVSQFIALRPDLAPILNLSVGTLAGVTRGLLVCLLSETDENLLTAP